MTFKDRVGELSATVKSEPLLVDRLGPTTDAVDALHTRFQDLARYAGDRKVVLEKIKAVRLAKMRRKTATPPMVHSPPATTTSSVGGTTSSPLASPAVLPAGSADIAAMSELHKVPTPVEGHSASRDSTNAVQAPAEAPLSLKQHPSHANDSLNESTDSFDSVGKRSGPCVIAFKSIDDRTLNNLMKTLADSVSVVAEYTLLGDKHIDGDKLVGVQVVPAEYGVVTANVDASIFFDVDLDTTLTDLAGHGIEKTRTMSAPAPVTLNAAHFHNVSAL
jgi:hypothetical protein